MGGIAWFGIDSKSFEISTEFSRGKFSGVITEEEIFRNGSDLVIEAFPCFWKGWSCVVKG